MSMKELMSHGFVIKEYGYDLYSIAKAYNQLPDHSNERELYLKDLKRYSENINGIAQAISKIIENEEVKEKNKN
jgi:hypothetical protein